VTSGLVPVADPIGDEHLGTWASTFLQIASVSAQLARTPFVPASLRVLDKGRYDEGATAANVAAAILTGQEIGMEPMAALRSINVINATPALSALALRALAQKQGHHIWLREATNTRAIVEGLRAGEDESRVQAITWTMDDAKSRSLAGRPNWRSQPRNMLIARATSEVVRLVAADAVLGIPYSIEELQDGDLAAEAAEDGAPAPAAPKRTARRKAAAALPSTSAQVGPGAAENGSVATEASEPPGRTSEDEPPLDDAVGPHVDEPAGGHVSGYMDEPPLDGPPPSSGAAESEVAGPAPITDAQRRALQASFRELGVERAERLRTVTGMVGRPVKSANDLTADEAARVLNLLALSKAQSQGAEPEAEDDPPLDDEIPATAPATGADFVTVREAFDAAQFAGGRENQDARVRYASNIVGRQLADPRDLTHGEALELVAALRIVAEELPPPDAEGM
jgi:hypothetical protein